MVNKKRITPALQRRIDEVNKLIKEADEKYLDADSYFGGTIGMSLDLLPIRVKSQFVTIEDRNHNKVFNWGYGKERFNVNKEDDLGALKSDLGYIKRALVKAIRRGY